MGDESLVLDKYKYDSINWEYFVSLTVRHRVWPIVYRVLSSQNSIDIPEEELSKLKQLNRKNSLKALAFSAETSRVVSEFNKIGIPSLLLKGVALAQQLYGDISLRPSRDIDLLIQPSQLQKANQVLKQLGYQHQYFDIEPFSPQQMRMLLKRNHHHNYKHPHRSVVLELHWKFKANFFGKFNEIEHSNDNSFSIDINNVQVKILNRRDNLLYLCVHGSLHGWFRLRWLQDFVLLSKMMTKEDWKDLWKRAKDQEILHILIQGCVLAHSLFDIPITLDLSDTNTPRKFLKPMIFQSLESISGPEPIVGKYFSKTFFLKKHILFTCNPKIKHKLLFLVNHFRPGHGDLTALKIPEVLFPLYYMIRPILLFYRMFIKRFV
ncbi:MAG: nucleotidyltransferase family protein [Deltaproteobacteria bacterium]|nr:nucleotidyltransferase family protein [Deltaproteobacteria bacterium]